MQNLQNTFDSSPSLRLPGRRAASQAAHAVAATNAAAADVDNVAIFAKFMKKAEDTAQASI
ncbi:hypothetical protein J8I26_04390 [Herbaspirillum sp. LeCh32-8]|uniref:hypothetical protein n=1 Tax=Herbaspirillum sp. LeCh32-8 TaxID=2821356 RepID=UPI001AEAAF3C|nr:hypothetical protein [Herbaspirillum sp. LeCh32-8]MBP0597330.1 hypothetical protein [Herbaspirillum sp. LeCh32-8]